MKPINRKLKLSKNKFSEVPFRKLVPNIVTMLALCSGTSWESGAFFFINKPLEEVFAYLSKWYGFRYSFRDEAAGKVKIGAYLNRYKNMNPIIDMIEDLNLVRISQKDDTLYITTK